MRNFYKRSEKYFLYFLPIGIVILLQFKCNLNSHQRIGSGDETRKERDYTQFDSSVNNWRKKLGIPLLEHSFFRTKIFVSYDESSVRFENSDTIGNPIHHSKLILFDYPSSKTKITNELDEYQYKFTKDSILQLFVSANILDSDSCVFSIIVKAIHKKDLQTGLNNNQKVLNGLKSQTVDSMLNLWGLSRIDF